MVKNKKQKTILSWVALLIIAFISHTPALVIAATLGVQSTTTSVTTGQTFSARITVNTQGKTMNNAEAVITFPTSLLEVVSVSSAGSIATLWVENPSYSNSSGTVSFNGGVPNPGYSGSGGLLATIQFRAKSSGNAIVAFASAAVRENDGLGTNILAAKSGASIAITTAPVATPSPTPPATPTPTTPRKDGEPLLPEVTPTPTIDALSVTITEYTTRIKEGERITATGALPIGFSNLKIFLQTESGPTRSYSVNSSQDNTFTFESEPIATAGMFKIWTEANDQNGNTIASEQKEGFVQASYVTTIRNVVGSVKNFFGLQNSLIVILAIVSATGWYNYWILKRKRYAVLGEPKKKPTKKQ